MEEGKTKKRERDKWRKELQRKERGRREKTKKRGSERWRR